ncbi:MAG: CopG family transcriptional regulator [Thermoplasmata archaeon]|nr:CopG family transcriptional regulator [Thermoplasmata archaeon]
MEQKYTTISIPTQLANKIKKRIKNTGFNSLSSYVTYVLRQVISSIEEEEQDKEAFSKEDEDKIKDRLRALGYLD